MKFGNLSIENFLSIQTAIVPLDGRGLVNIEGLNLDDTSANSNGAGKSSIFDALMWALFGETARGESGDGVINRALGKGCRVQLELFEGDDRWMLTRHRKHKTGKNELHLHHYASTSGFVDLTQGKDALTQAKVVEVLGCSMEVFKGAVYSGQEAMPDLPGMTDKSLKVLVEEASGTTLLDKAYRIALDDVTAAKAVIVTADHALARANDDLGHHALSMRDGEERKADWEEQRTLRVTQFVTAAKAAAGNVKAIATAAAAFDRVSLNREIATADAAIKAMDRQKVEHNYLIGQVSAANLKLERAKAATDLVRRQTRDLSDRIDQLDHQVGCPCTGCARPYSAEDIAPAKAAATLQRDKRGGDLPAALADENAASDALTNAVEARDAFAATMTDVSATIAARDAASASLALLDGHVRNQATWTATARERAAQATAAKTEANPFDAAIAKSKASYEASGLAVEAAEKACDTAAEKLQIAQDVASVFSPSGVRAHILDTVTPFLNDRTARYLGTLSDGNISASWTTLVKNAKGELKEKFAIEVANDLGGATFRSISGGEKRKVRVACALALQDLVASRATKPIDLFVGDEIDDALDVAGLERLMTILDEKARERGSVFVISHGNLRDWIRTTMIVTKQHKISTIAEAA